MIDANTAVLADLACSVLSAVSRLHIGVAVLCPDDKLLVANERFWELLELNPDDLPVGQPLGALAEAVTRIDGCACDDRLALRAALQAGVGRAGASRARCRRASGSVLDLVFDPLEQGGWALSVADATQLTRAEDEARQRAVLLDSIIENVPHGICVYGPDRRVRLFNRTYTEVMEGAPVAVGDHITDVIRRRAEAGEYGPGDVEAIYQEQLAYDIGRPQQRRRRRPNGKAMDVRTAPLPDGGHISVVTDITALTESEDRARRRAEELTIMLAGIRQGITVWSAEGRIIASNDRAAQLLGHPPGVLVPGRSQREIVEHMLARGAFGTGERAAAWAEQLMKRDWSAGVYDREFVTAEGRLLHARSEPTPSGGFVTTFTDITEEHAAQREQRRARDAAESANRAKSRFLATMSHELRTPLNVVIGFAEALSREGDRPDPARVAEYAGEISTAGRQLLALINSILDVSRIETGRFELADDQVDVASLLHTAARRADAAAQAAEVTLRVELPEALPPLRADERRLAQVLGHLLTNAVKFTEAGGTVTLGAVLEADGRLLIRVADTGVGIAESDLQRVFEPFIQLDGSLARRFEGSGLGLYVSRALVQGHGGSLALSSRPGVGTTAEIRMPAERVVAAGPHPKQEDIP